MTLNKIEAMMDLMDNLSDPVAKKHIAHAMKRELNRVVRTALNTTPGPSDNDRITDEERNFVLDGQKIQAIKLVRTRTGLGLLEAKMLVEWCIDPSKYPKPDYL